MSDRPVRGRHVSKRRISRYRPPLCPLTTLERTIRDTLAMAARRDEAGDHEFAATLRKAAEGMATLPDPEKENQ